MRRDRKGSELRQEPIRAGPRDALRCTGNNFDRECESDARKPSISRRAGSLAFEVVACTSRRGSRRGAGMLSAEAAPERGRPTRSRRARAAPGRASAMRSQRAGAGAAPGRARPPRSDVLATTSTESAQATRKPSIARRAGSLAFEVVACTSRRESRRDRPRLTSPRNVRVSARYGCRSCRSRSSASTFVDQGRADAHQLSRRGRSSFRCRISPTRSPYAVGFSGDVA